jgi:hypothetical protein
MSYRAFQRGKNGYLTQRQYRLYDAMTVMTDEIDETDGIDKIDFENRKWDVSPIFRVAFRASTCATTASAGRWP